MIDIIKVGVEVVILIGALFTFGLRIERRITRIETKVEWLCNNHKTKE